MFIRPSLAAVTILAATPALADEVTVFAAASLKTALDQIATEWSAATGHTLAISYGGSSQLAQQIEQGAPADLFISASTAWMDEIAAAGLLAEGSRRDLLGNSLVLVAHGDTAPVTLGPGLDLVGLLGGGKLAMALVDSVPAGQYGKESLESLGLWAAVEPHVAQAENVRAALALVAAGEAPYGIVYASDEIADAGSGDNVTVVGTFPADSHSPIVYPAAVLATAATPAAADFLDYLASDAADAVFVAQGFTILD